MSSYAKYSSAGGSSGGSGNVVGPISSTVGDIAVFSNTSGTGIADSTVALTGTTSITLTPATVTTTAFNLSGYTNASGDGGSVNLLGGVSTGGNGGAITIRGGNANSGTTTQGGALSLFAGSSNSTAAGSAITITAGANSSTGAGGALILTAGRTVGGTVQGSINFRTGSVSGGTLRASIDGLGNMFLGTAALATNAANGFVNIPSMAGEPSGTPTLTSGLIPLIYDSTDDQLLAYNSSWKIIQNIIAENNAGNSSTAITVNFAAAPAQVITLTGNAVVTLSGTKSGGAYVLRVLSGAGGWTCSLTGVKWPGGVAPIFTASASAIDIVNIYSDGTNLYGTISQAFA